LRKVLAATHRQVWWPATGHVLDVSDHLPVWHEASRSYVDPLTGEALPTWEEALDAIGEHDEPWYVVRFGTKFDAQGVLGCAGMAADRIARS